ncbi:hypothetical protein LTR08_005013 [Meristemomyces frigidus]|nr:hypothetical protein LTR08_005013 [Meristemomyces frigidus]
MDSLPSPPFIEIPGIANFRGVGGDHVGPGLVFRSADPTKATKVGLEKMRRDLGIRVIFDLRSAPEIKRDGPEWVGVDVDNADVFEPYGMTRQWVPVFAEKDYGPEQVALRYKEYTKSGSEGFVQAYRDILLAAPSSYGTILRHMAQPKPMPCLIHCTAGKDRTGVLVALLFMLADAPTKDIAEEYALTDLGLAPMKPLFRERLLQNPVFEGNTEGVENMISSKAENMTATVEMIINEFGGSEVYIQKNCGLSEDEVKLLRKNITAGALASM